MTTILDTVKMSEPAITTTSPEAEAETPDLPPIEDVRDAVANFLKEMVDAKKVNVTKLALLDYKKGMWEAEAEVFVPNPTIMALGLPVKREVLDCEMYLLRLDEQLNIVSFALSESIMDERDRRGSR